MYDQSKLIEILKTSEFRCIDLNGKCFPPSNSMYQKVSEEMKKFNSNINPKHVYTILNTNRRGIYLEILEAFNLKKVIEKSPEKMIDESFNVSSFEHPKQDNKTFRLIISEKNWDKIKPVAKQYSTRRYLKLKPGEWTDVFAAKIWEQTKIPCAFTFKNATIFPSLNAKSFARFNAVCKECKAILRGKMSKKPNNGQDAIFDCDLFGFDDQLVHIKKRQLKGSLRRKIAGHLVDAKKQATIWRIEEANRIMEFGDKNPPILYSPRVLRKAKQAELDNRLGVDNNHNAVQNLQTFKYMKVPGSIHAIGLDPFYVMYWSKEQMTMHKLINRSKSAYFTMDATGGIAKALILPDGTKSAHLFLYQCMIVPKDKQSIPTFQMISSKQDAALLTYFLLEIRRIGATVPSVTVTDHSRAILVALARAFADCADLKHYLQCCYDISIKNKETFLPASYLRLDISHVIKIVSKWECLRHQPRKVRQFYLRCISQAYKMHSIEELHSFLTSLLIVALSEDVGYIDDTSVPAQASLQSINDCIKGINIEESESMTEDDTILSISDDFDHEEMPSSWQEWSDDIYTKANTLALESCNGNVVNAFYNPKAAQKIRSMIKNVPLWTGIMRSHFKAGMEVATSSSVESIFAEYKSRLFKGCIPMRVDKFVISHLNYIDGRLRLDFANTTEQKSTDSTEQNIENSARSDSFNNVPLLNSTPIDENTDNSVTTNNSDEKTYHITSDSSVDNSFNYKENWMGLTDKDIKKYGNIKKKTYLDKCPEWDSVESNHTVIISIMKNGHLCQPVKLCGQNIMIRNTCAFDALLHITVHIIGMHIEYKHTLHKINDRFLQLALKIASGGKIRKKRIRRKGLFSY